MYLEQFMLRIEKKYPRHIAQDFALNYPDKCNQFVYLWNFEFKLYCMNNNLPISKRI